MLSPTFQVADTIASGPEIFVDTDKRESHVDNNFAATILMAARSVVTSARPVTLYLIVSASTAGSKLNRSLYQD